VSSACRDDREGVVFLSLLGSGDVLLMCALRFYDFTLLSVGISIQWINTCENDRGMRQKGPIQVPGELYVVLVCQCAVNLFE